MALGTNKTTGRKVARKRAKSATTAEAKLKFKRAYLENLKADLVKAKRPADKDALQVAIRQVAKEISALEKGVPKS